LQAAGPLAASLNRLVKENSLVGLIPQCCEEECGIGPLAGNANSRLGHGSSAASCGQVEVSLVGEIERGSERQARRRLSRCRPRFTGEEEEYRGRYPHVRFPWFSGGELERTPPV